MAGARRLVGVLAGASVLASLAAGCAGGSKTVAPEPTESSARQVPSPPLARVLPRNYRAQRVWHANLTGGAVADVVVTSVGPPSGSLNFHPADLQVLSWDGLARRWNVLFDAQKVTAPTSTGPQDSNAGPYWAAGPPADTTPLLDPTANITLGRVAFAPILRGKRNQLLFSASWSYGGSGVPGELVIVDFRGGVADLAYVWSGDGGIRWRLRGSTVTGRAAYWTTADAHCCPTRSYRFTIGRRGDYITELSDTRPWLGALVRPVGTGADASLKIIDVAQRSPAASVLRAGDVILSVENAPKHPEPGQVLSSALLDEITAFDAGQTAKLLVGRDGAQLTLSVKLGSLAGAEPQLLPANDYTVSAL